MLPPLPAPLLLEGRGQAASLGPPHVDPALDEAAFRDRNGARLDIGDDTRVCAQLEAADDGEAALDVARDDCVACREVAGYAAALVHAAEALDVDGAVERARQLYSVAAGQDPADS